MKGIKRITGYLYAAFTDISAIECLCRDGINRYPEVIAFHSQQAAGKTLKNSLTTNGIIPPKTHDIVALMALAQDKLVIKVSQQSINAANQLQDYAVLARYRFSPEISATEARLAI